MDLYEATSWDSPTAREHPWYICTIRPLGTLNELLEEAGATERLFVLYPGGTKGFALLIDPECVAEIAASEFGSEGEIPLEAVW